MNSRIKARRKVNNNQNARLTPTTAKVAVITWRAVGPSNVSGVELSILKMSL